jgi:ADP-heptose:LPS heptosyltransferase
VVNPRNVLFIAEGQVGDLLVLTPVLRAVKNTFPSARLSVLALDRRRSDAESTGPNVRPAGTRDRTWQILSGNPSVDQVFVLSRPRLRSLAGLRRVRAELAAVRFLRSRKFDTVICTFPEDRFALWAYLSGARVRVGQSAQPFHWLLTHKPDTGKERRGILQSYCDLVSSIGTKIDSTQTFFFIPPSSHSWAESFLASHGLGTDLKLVAVHPGGTDHYKIWPPERYASLIDRLQADKRIRTILCWSSEDGLVVSEIKRSFRTSCIDVQTGDNIGNLGALLQRCSLCISNDSGPRHLANAVSAPSLGFLRQFDDREWRVYPEDDTHATLQGKERCPACPPGSCACKTPVGERFGSYCLRMISVDAAFARACQLLFKSIGS